MSDDLRIGFLGAGKMATALAQGWLRAGLVRADRLRAGDPLAEARAAFAQATSGQGLANNRAVVADSDLIILAVKPQHMADTLAEIAPSVQAGNPLVVSIAAGVPLQTIADRLGAGDARLVRVMPNTPCLVGASASAYAAGAGATAEDIRLVDRLFNAVGRAFAVPEKLLDAVTGLSGSGPAFVFVIIEALSDGGVRMGLPRDLATVLAAQTVLGSAKLLLETGLHPGALKDMVASPAGTTIAGLHALERGGLRAALIDAVEAASQRSAELGRSG
jgi:pyrroline-5-carboxylate reductase